MLLSILVLKPRRIELWVDALNAPYVITKPLHNSQRVIQQNDDGSVIVHLFLIENYEFERIILGFGSGMEVIRPEQIRKTHKNYYKECLFTI